MKTTQIFMIFILMICLRHEINAQYFGGYYSGSKSVEFNNYKIVNEIFYGGYNDGFTSKEFNNYKLVNEMYRGGDNDGYNSNQIYLLNIPLSMGWNLISTYIQPQLPDTMNNVMDEIKSNLLIAKNNGGQVYIPSYDINTIGKWNVTQGYLVYMSAKDTLTITGNAVVPSETPISLSAGWNTIAYLRNAEMSAELSFASITDNNNLLIAKTLDGKVYIPSYNINTIGNLKPGVGYKLYVTTSDTLVYPGN